MKFIIAIFGWIWKAITLFAPFASVLYGAVVVSSFIGAVVGVYVFTSDLISSVNSALVRLSDGVIVSLQDVFQAMISHQLGNAICYCLAIDYPFRWLASASEFILGTLLSVFVGILASGVAGSLVIVGIYFVRKRVRNMVFGFGGGGS